jgi:hypothetical protein
VFLCEQGTGRRGRRRRDDDEEEGKQTKAKQANIEMEERRSNHPGRSELNSEPLDGYCNYELAILDLRRRFESIRM